MLSLAAKDIINTIFVLAFAEGRTALFEFEVYEILKAIGLDVPRYLFVKDGSPLEPDAVQSIGAPVVIKVVSADIAHKQKVGGVRVLNDVGMVARALEEMKRTVLSFYADNEQPEIKGFLITEFVPFASSLGYEVLFGIKQDAAFGPVLTLSKGGDDAEFFAKYYDPANLIIPPLSFEEALREVKSILNIWHKFESEHEKYLSHLAKVLAALGDLATCYSPLTSEDQPFSISEMDINPFVLAMDSRFIAVDGFARFERTTRKPQLPAVRTQNIDSFFRPQGIAVFGVSADMQKYSIGRAIATLLHSFSRDDLFFINVKGGSLAVGDKTYPLYRSIDEIDAQVDLAVYAAPAQFTMDFAKAVAKKGVKAVILISGIPSDMNYSDFKADLAAVLPRDIRVIGPNCMGVFSAPDERHPGLNTLFIEEKNLEVRSSTMSNTVLITQSGALGLTLIDQMNNVRIFKSVVSFGNKFDVNATDLLTSFAVDDTIEVIAMYVEGFDEGEGRVFFEQVKDVNKPVVVYKSGKTEAGAKAAASHTASMSGSFEVFKAACRQANVLLAERIDEYEDCIRMFSLLSHRKPAGNRVAAVFNAGFEATIGADELGCLKQAQLRSNTLERLRQADRSGLVDVRSSFLDITPMANDKMYADFVEALLLDDSVDMVLVAIVPYTSALRCLKENCRDEEGLAHLLAQLSRKYDKPFAVSVNGGAKYLEFVSVLEESGMPVYRNVFSAFQSMQKFVSYHMRSEK